MDTSIPVIYEMFHPVSWPPILNATFSQALAAGHTHCGWLVGPTINPFGQGLALVSHSASLERVEAQKTRDTYGPLFGGSSPSADLQESLVSRLRKVLPLIGSPVYAMTWKPWDIGSGESLCRLAASGRTTSGCDRGGWPTTTVQDAENNGGPSQYDRNSLPLNTLVMLTTPEQSGGPVETESEGESPRDGWATPTAHKLTLQGRDNRCLARDVFLAGWGTPRVTTNDGTPSPEVTGKGSRLEDQAGTLAGYPTLTANSKGGGGYQNPQKLLQRTKAGHTIDLKDFAHPLQPPGLTGWKLNPRFSLWLMGYPAAWASCGERAMQFIRKSRRSS